MRFRLLWFRTKEENKYEAQEVQEYLGDKKDIWLLWYTLKEIGWPHVEVYHISGYLCEPEKGILTGMPDFAKACSKIPVKEVKENV